MHCTGEPGGAGGAHSRVPELPEFPGFELALPLSCWTTSDLPLQLSVRGVPNWPNGEKRLVAIFPEMATSHIRQFCRDVWDVRRCAGRAGPREGPWGPRSSEDGRRVLVYRGSEGTRPGHHPGAGFAGHAGVPRAVLWGLRLLSTRLAGLPGSRSSR